MTRLWLCSLPVILLSTFSLAVAGCGDSKTRPESDSGADTGLDDAGDAGEVDAADGSTITDPGTILVAPTSGLRTTEGAGTTNFTVVLGDEPSASVTIAVVSSDPTEGTVSPQVLTFTADNWSAPQTVTVTGVDDAEADGDQTYAISTVPAGSSDPRYAGRVGMDVTVINTDDETAGVTVGTISGAVTETGATATFTLVLNSRPTADVVIGLSSDDPSEGSVESDSVTFTIDNWNAPRTITVTGVDDEEADGNVIFHVVTASATSSDGAYDGLDADDITVENVDNETANVIVSAASGPTGENGTTATFTVALTSAPTANVSISVSSSEIGEGTVSTDTLVFTPDNWNAAQTVTVTGVDDDVADGNQPYSAVLGNTSSTDSSYDDLSVDDVDLVNLDNDTAGFLVTAISDQTTEAGGSATFTVVLLSQPAADVVIAVESDDTTEGETDVALVTFTTDNWNAAQTVTVTGVNDDLADGDQVFEVTLGAAQSDDTNYDGLDPADVAVTNSDNETPGITVSAPIGDTTEGGGSTTLSVVLNSQPTAAVTVPVVSSDATEGSASPIELVFDADNWNAAQIITVTGEDDDLDDGNQTYRINVGPSASGDADYEGLSGDSVDIVNVDNDTAGFTVTNPLGTTSEGGASTTFTIVLNTRPTADVTIDLTSSDVAEGSVSPASITFTVDNWNSERVITVTGENDGLTDGDQQYTIQTSPAVSADPRYLGLDPADVTVTNIDNETPGIIVSAVGRATTEAGGTATLTIRLRSQPSADVVIPLSSSDITEGTASPASLTFTALNWNAPQSVTLRGVDDDVADGNQTYFLVTAPAMSADPSYNGMNGQDRPVINTDNETPGFTVSTISGDTTELGDTATFTIELNSEPVSDVTITLVSNTPTEGTAAPGSVTFTAGTWNMPQTITVTGVDDAIADGTRNYAIVTSAAVSADPKYNGLDPADVAVRNVDNDTAGFLISAISGNTTEDGGTASFTIRLTSRPSANVRVNLVSNNTDEGTVSPASVTFTSGSWDMEQTVTVRGVDDTVADGNQPYTIRTQAAVSTDAGYSGMNPADVDVINEDNDSVVILVTAISRATNENGRTAVFLIALTTRPSANVTIGLSSSNTDEGTVAPSSVTFTPSNWNSPRTVTVTGVNDNAVDGSVAYTIITAPAVSLDPLYNGIDPADVDVINLDND